MLIALGVSAAHAESERIAVEGVVEDDLTGEPLGGITVVGEHLIFHEPSSSYDVGVVQAHEFDRDQTDDQGRYQLEGAALAESNRSQVSTVDEIDRSFRYLARTLELPTGSGTQPFTPIAVSQSGTVRGHVTDDESGEPIPGVGVRGSGPSAPFTGTRDDGSYELTGVRPGELQIRFERYAASKTGRHYLPSESPPLFVQRATATTGVDAALVPRRA